MLAEFDWTAKPTPSFPLTQHKKDIFGGYKVYLLKPMTQYGMLRVKHKVNFLKKS